MQIFVKSERDYVGEEMSVGMFATPLTLSAAALSWIPRLNSNRCSTARIRQGDLAVLFHCAVRLACIMRMSSATFVFVFFMFSARTPPAELRVRARLCRCVHLFYVFVCVPVCCVCVSVCVHECRWGVL